MACIFYNILDNSIDFHKYSYALIYKMNWLELIDQLFLLLDLIGVNSINLILGLIRLTGNLKIEYCNYWNWLDLIRLISINLNLNVIRLLEIKTWLL